MPEMNFVQRYRSPSKFPVLDNGDGSISTHSMSWGEVDDGYVAFPTVVQKGDKLERLSGRDAFRYAIENNEFMRFDNDLDAKGDAEGDDEDEWGAEDATVYEGDFAGAIDARKAA